MANIGVGHNAYIGIAKEIKNISAESIGTGDGTTTTFSGTLAHTPVVTSSVTVTADTITLTDDGSGNLTGTGGSGTITYATGAISVTYTTAPASGVDISTAYQYGAWGTAVAPTTFLEFVDESIVKVINPIEPGALVGTRFKNGKYMIGSIDINGNFSIEANPDNIGLLLGAALGSETTTQVGTTTAYDHVMTPADSLPSISIEVNRDVASASGKAFRYSGCNINTLALSCDINAVLKAEFGILGKDEAEATAATASYSTLLPYVYTMGTVSIDGSAVAYVKGFSFNLNNNLYADRYVLNAGQNRTGTQPQGSELTGSLDMEWTTTAYAERTKYLAGTDAALELIFTSTETIEAGYYYTLTISIPHMKYTKADANVSGKDVIPFAADWEAWKSGSTAIVTVTHRDARTTNWTTE